MTKRDKKAGAISPKLRFIVVKDGYWGGGDTLDEAKTNFRKAGGSGRKPEIRVVAWNFGKEGSVPLINEMGSLIIPSRHYVSVPL